MAGSSFNPAEARGKGGKWTSGAAAVAGNVTGKKAGFKFGATAAATQAAYEGSGPTLKPEPVRRGRKGGPPVAGKFPAAGAVSQAGAEPVGSRRQNKGATIKPVRRGSGPPKLRSKP